MVVSGVMCDGLAVGDPFPSDADDTNRSAISWKFAEYKFHFRRNTHTL
jgi:hypothetical protein